MKRAVILHGTSGNPSKNWYPWLKEQLEKEGYEVWVPQLPDSDIPNRFTYEKFFKAADWDFSENLVIGHSSGTTAILNLLSSDWFPHIKSAVLVGTFLNEDLTKTTDWYTDGQFDDLFPPNGFDAKVIKSKSDNFYFIHSDNDPFCDPEPAQQLSEELDGVFVLVPGAEHFSEGMIEIPELLKVLRDHSDL
jgi:predicted alpha/beta hydrolase family esterase